MRSPAAWWRAWRAEVDAGHRLSDESAVWAALCRLPEDQRSAAPIAEYANVTVSRALAALDRMHADGRAGFRRSNDPDLCRRLWHAVHLNVRESGR